MTERAGEPLPSSEAGFSGPNTESLPSDWEEKSREPDREPDYEDLTKGAVYGRYEILDVLGRGGMGVVYQALDLDLQRMVALKALTQVAASTTLLQEARRQVQVEHANICPVHNVVTVNGAACLEMRYVNGCSLAQLPRERADWRTVVDLTWQVTLALAAAHKRGVIHRDIKPSNILLDLNDPQRPHAYLSDFGLAIRQTAPSGTAQQLFPCGTKGFMAPEQARDGISDERSDIYSLGATLYAALTGKPPMTPEKQDQAIHGQWKITPPRQLVSGLSWELEAIVMKCLEEDPRLRYRSAEELASDLGRLLKGDPVHAAQRTLVGRLKAAWSVHRDRFLALSGLLLLLSVSAALWLWQARQGRLRAEAERAVAAELGRIEREMQLELLLPFHDVAPARHRLLEQVHRLETWQDRWGRAGRPAVVAGLARAHLELGDVATAQELLESARRGGVQDPDLDEALAAVLLHRFTVAARRVETLLRGHEREAELARLEASLLHPAVNLLDTGREPPAVAVERLLAEGRPRAALQTLEDGTAPAIPPHRLATLRGEVWLWTGRRQVGRGNTAGATASFEKAHELFQRAVDIARSDPVAHRDLCAVASEALWMAVERGDAATVRGLASQAQEACSRAQRADTSSAEEWSGLALLDYRLAEYCQYSVLPKSPGEHGLLERALSEARQAIAIDAEDPFPRLLAVSILRRLADSALTKHSGEPGPWIGEALRQARALVAKEPGSAVAVHLLGAVQRTVADTVCSQFPSRSPIPCRRAPGEAIATLSRAVELDPTYALAWKDLAYVHEITGMRETSLHGIRALDHLAHAIHAATRALALRPCYYDALDNLAQSLEAVGWWVADHGGDPAPWLERASTVFHRDFACAPSRAYAILNEAGMWITAGRFRTETSAWPERQLAREEAVLDLEPRGSWESWWAVRLRRLGSQAAMARAAARLRHGLDATRDLQVARKERHPCARATDCEDMAWLGLLEAREAVLQGRSPSAAATRCRHAEERPWKALDAGLSSGLIPLSVVAASPRADVAEARWLLAHGRDASVPMTHLERCARILGQHSDGASGFLWALKAWRADLKARASNDPAARRRLHAEARRDARLAVALDANLAHELRELTGKPAPPSVRSSQ